MFIFRKQNMKFLVYLVIVLGLAPFFMEERKVFLKFRALILMSDYSAVILAVFLVAEVRTVTRMDYVCVGHGQNLCISMRNKNLSIFNNT